MTITDQLLHFLHQPVPDAAAQMMRLSLFDWAACGLAGAAEGSFDRFVALEMAQGGGRCTVFGQGQGQGQANPATAALLNGTLSHALDYDDTHFDHIGHPSVAVIPAVLALGEERGATLNDVISAATLGVEASILTGLWLGRAHYQIGYHQTATAGAFGATVAALRLLHLDAAQDRHALGLCASLASGLKAQFGTMGKPLNAGLAARAGVQAVSWAATGMTAAQDGLAGPLGFGPTHHADMADVSLPGETWRIEAISHKFHACCHGLHAMLEALGDATIPVVQIKSIAIRTHPRWMSVCNIITPETGLAAKFSYGQTAAMRLLGHDTGAIANYTDAITADPNVRSLREKVTVIEDARLTETQAEVQIISCDGGNEVLRHDLMTPIPQEVRAAKLQSKAAALLGKTAAQALWQAAQGDGLQDFTDQLVMS